MPQNRGHPRDERRSDQLHAPDGAGGTDRLELGAYGHRRDPMVYRAADKIGCISLP
jgi:hypothetical protein